MALSADGDIFATTDFAEFHLEFERRFIAGPGLAHRGNVVAAWPVAHLAVDSPLGKLAGL